MLHLHSNRSGFTLIELMVVVAIIAILATLAVSIMSRNSLHNALTSLTNEVVSALQTQRSRALTTSRAMYITFDTANGGTLNLYAGTDSHCSTVSSARLDIRYNNTGTGVVGIDLAPNSATKRTLSSVESSEYYGNDKSRVKITASGNKFTISSNKLSGRTSVPLDGLTVCFQPNGETMFFQGINNASATDVNEVILKIEANVAGDGAKDLVGGYANVTVEQFGFIESAFIPYS